MFFFLHFKGWNLENFKIEFKGPIAFLKSFQMPFSDFENSNYILRYIEKTWKNVPPLFLLYLKNYGMNRYQILIHKFYVNLQTFMSDNIFL